MAPEPRYIQIAREIKEQWIAQPERLTDGRLPTERDLQAHFSVSRATISRALSVLSAENLIVSRQGSGAYLREDVEIAAYTKLIGFIAPYIPLPDGRHQPIIQRIYYGVEKRARELGYQVLSASANFSVDHEEALVTQYLRLGAEGIVIYPVYFPQPRLASRANEDYLARRLHKARIVLVDVGSEDWQRSMICFDNCRLGLEVTQALMDHGARNILFMHTYDDHIHNSVHERANGWRLAHERACRAIPDSYSKWPVDVCGYVHEISDEAADTIAASLLQLHPRPDAVIAWDDAAAIALIRALQRKGVSVPHDVRVCGFDNHPEGRYFQPAFPTTDPDFSALGESAIDLLHRQISQGMGTPRTYIHSVPVVWRSPDTAEFCYSGSIEDSILG